MVKNELLEKLPVTNTHLFDVKIFKPNSGTHLQALEHQEAFWYNGSGFYHDMCHEEFNNEGIRLRWDDDDAFDLEGLHIDIIRSL